MNDFVGTFGVITGLLLLIFGIALVFCWILLPFIIMGTNKRLDKILNELKRTSQKDITYSGTRENSINNDSSEAVMTADEYQEREKSEVGLGLTGTTILYICAGAFVVFLLLTVICRS